jgi:signal transduction histidine kinase/CheY-like chemotaxis protein
VPSEAPVSSKSEHERLRALGRLDILDTPHEEAFDRITQLLPPIFGVPIAGISFVGETQLWLKATVGFDRVELKRDIAFCGYAIKGPDVMVLLDTQKDPLFCENPLACGEAGIRFYAAAPLITDDSHAVGTVWIADRVPRAGFSAEKRQMLSQFAGIVMDELELRLSHRRIADALKARGHVEQRLRLVNRISGESAAAPNFRVAIRAVAKLLAEHFDVDYAQVWSLAPDGSRIELEGEYAAPDERIEAFRAIIGGETLTTENSLIGDAAVHQRALSVSDLGEIDPAQFPWAAVARKHGLVSLLCLPFRDARNRFALSFLFKTPPADLTAIAEMIVELSGEIQSVLGHKQRDDALRQAQRMEAVGQLTGGIAHGFNNMLTVIAGNLDRVIGTLPEGAAPRRLLASAMLAALKAEKLTKQLLAYSRRHPLRPQPVDINLVTGRVGAAVRGMLGGRIMMYQDLAADLAPALVDPDQFEAALLNILFNARDAMPNGGSITVATANLTLDEAAAGQLELSPGGYAELRVADTGEGMTPEVLARAFEPFFTTRTVGEGTGLGLSQVYGFVTQSKGRVELESKLGAGTVVRILLPSGPTVAPAPTPVPPTILVVEDDDLVREFAVSALRDQGYTVLEASSGAPARELFASHTIDLLFTDLLMPGVSGLDLIEALRAERPDLPVILTSGYATALVKGDLPRGLRFLHKPYDPMELYDTLADLLGVPPTPLHP